MPILNWIGKEKIVSYHQDVPYKILEHRYDFIEKGEYLNGSDSQQKLRLGKSGQVKPKIITAILWFLKVIS